MLHKLCAPKVLEPRKLLRQVTAKTYEPYCRLSIGIFHMWHVLENLTTSWGVGGKATNVTPNAGQV